MKIFEIVNRNIITVNPNETLRNTILRLNDHGIGAVLITEKNHTLKGIFTERDLLRAMPDSIDEKMQMPIHNFMTKNPQTIDMNESLIAAEKMMAQGKFRHLPVLNSKNLIGIISSKDIFESLLISNHFQQQQLESIKIIVGTMSHEINNPVAAILGKVAKLKKCVSDPSGEEHIGMIENSLRRITQVMRKLSRLEDMVFEGYGPESKIIDVATIRASIDECIDEVDKLEQVRKAS